MVCLLPQLTAASVQSATIVSDFDAGSLEGWSKGPGYNGSLFVDTATGNPGGSMAITDAIPAGGGLYAKAPPSYAGDLTAFAGIAWDRFVPDRGGNTRNTGAVVLVGGPQSTAYVYEPALVGLGSWVAEYVPFQSVHWGQLDIAQLGATGADPFETVVQDVHSVYLAGDTSTLASGVLEIRLDNVTLIPVPEPTGLAALSVGVLAVFCRRRERRWIGLLHSNQRRG